MKHTIKFKVKALRKMPEFTGIPGERYIAMVSVTQLPKDIPTAPNPREPNINRRIWKTVQRELFNIGSTPNAFHLKNKGITIIADRVHNKLRKGSSDSICEIVFDEDQDHGIVDGGHTFHLLCENQEKIAKYNKMHTDKINQYVKLEILSGYDHSLIPEIARGLNTGIQVKETSLADLSGKFECIKEALAVEPAIAAKVSYNENGRNPIMVTDIVRMLYCFNVAHFRRGDPSAAYSRVSTCLKHFIAHPNIYEPLSKHAVVIGKLANYIGATARQVWNSGQNARGGALTIIATAKANPFQFHFLGTDSPYKLEHAVLYPILSAFRCFLRWDEDKKVFYWTKTYTEMCDIWDDYGRTMLTTAKDKNYGSTLNLKGKNPQLWKMLHLEMQLNNR
jgi:hypothetical protein